MKTKTNFTDQVRKHLKRYGSINQLQAFEKYGSWKLASRILDLRNQGMNIETKMVSVTTRFGIKTEIAKYYLQK